MPVPTGGMQIYWCKNIQQNVQAKGAHHEFLQRSHFNKAIVFTFCKAKCKDDGVSILRRKMQHNCSETAMKIWFLL